MNPRPPATAGPWPAALVALAALFVTTLLVLLVRPSEDSEFEGLFNPIYMFLTTGRMTYPVHYAFDEMVIHPPIHYLEIALLMKAGVPGPLAVALVPWLLCLSALGLLTFSAVSWRLKIALAWGLAGTIAFSSPYGGILRPDLHLFLAWVAGLVALESGRAGGWVTWRLAAGAALVTYASAIHYFGAVAFLAVVPYGIAALRERGRAGARRACMALVAGGCLVGIPYLVFFVVPHWAGIMAIVKAVQGAGGSGEAFRKHLADYAGGLTGVRRLGLGSLLLAGLYRARVPVFLWSVPGLARAETCVLAAATLPLCSFVLFHSQGKSMWYYMPEAFVALSAAAYLVAAVAEAVARRGNVAAVARWGSGLFLSWTVVAPAITLYHRDLTPITALPVLAIDVLRAAARQIVGRNASIGGRIGAWYTSGAHEWYDVAGDLLWQESLAGIDPPSYFRGFDYLVEHAANSYVTANREGRTLGTWYADGTLHLHGFLFAHRRGFQDFDPEGRRALAPTGTAYHDALILSARPANRITGFHLSGRTLWRFSSAPEGTHVFVALVCPLTDPALVNRWDLPNFNQIFLPPTAPPKDGASLFAVRASPQEPQPSIVTSLLPESRWREIEPKMRAECRVRDLYTGTLERMDAMTLYRQEHPFDQPMVFDRARWKRRVAHPEGPLVPVARVALAGGGEATIRTPPTPWAYGAELPLAWSKERRGAGYLKARFRVREGVIGLGVVNRERNDFITRLEFPASPNEYCVFVPLPRLQKAGAVVVQTWEKAEAALVEVKELSLVMPAADGDPQVATCAVSSP